jgi:membrane dipeptidase
MNIVLASAALLASVTSVLLKAIRKVAGIDHIGIGSDFDGFSSPPPKGLEDVSKYPALLAELLQRGYTKDEIKKVAGLNLLRAMRAAERVAAEMQRMSAK